MGSAVCERAATYTLEKKTDILTRDTPRQQNCYQQKLTHILNTFLGSKIIVNDERI